MTPNEIVSMSPRKPQDDMDTMSVPELRAELSLSLSRTAEDLVRLARIVRLLEERGEDLSELRMGLMEYLRLIGHGQCRATLVVRFLAQPGLLRRTSSLPLPDQDRLAAGEPVELVVWGADGHTNLRQADPTKLVGSQIAQVFAAGRIRDQAEQILYLEEKGRKPARERKGNQKVAADLRRGGITVGRSFVPAAEAFRALAELYPVTRDDGDRTATLVVPLSEVEHGHLKDLASGAGVSMAVLVRRALMREGLLPGGE